MVHSVFRWEFGTTSFIDIYKDNCACAHFSYDDRLRVHVAWSVGYLSKDEWEQILDCVKEAKVILKKLKRV